MLLYEYRLFFLDGLLQTLKLSSVVAVGATLVAILLTAGLVHRNAILRRASFAVVEVLRDIPLMVAVLMTYFVLPRIGLSLDPFWSTFVSLSLWGGANGAQVLRAGLASVGRSQRETAEAFGLARWQALLVIVIPQAMPVIIPPYVGLLTALVQATSLGAIVGVHELLRTGQIVIEQTTIMRGGSPAYLVYGSILVVYFVICWSISWLGRRAERHFAKPYSNEGGRAVIRSRVAATAAKVETSA